MSKYEVVIYWSEEDLAYIAEVPELPGCMADGSTYQEALANAKQLSKNGSRQRLSWDGRFLSPRVD
jgi:predicted RNase H-like HicB family nuclease